MSLFYEIVQIYLGIRVQLSWEPSAEERREIYVVAQKQSVVGFLMPALERLEKQGVKPPVEILLEWIGVSEMIKQQTKVVNKRVVR